LDGPSEPVDPVNPVDPVVDDVADKDVDQKWYEKRGFQVTITLGLSLSTIALLLLLG